jgi:hypothetical protein
MMSQEKIQEKLFITSFPNGSELLRRIVKIFLITIIKVNAALEKDKI